LYVTQLDKNFDRGGTSDPIGSTCITFASSTAVVAFRWCETTNCRVDIISLSAISRTCLSVKSINFYACLRKEAGKQDTVTYPVVAQTQCFKDAKSHHICTDGVLLKKVTQNVVQVRCIGRFRGLKNNIKKLLDKFIAEHSLRIRVLRHISA
jgi:hypothetical protein